MFVSTDSFSVCVLFFVSFCLFCFAALRCVFLLFLWGHKPIRKQYSRKCVSIDVVSGKKTKWNGLFLLQKPPLSRNITVIQIHDIWSFRYWPVIDDALRKAAFDRKVAVRLLAGLWKHTRPDLKNFLMSLSAINGSKDGVSVETVCIFFESFLCFLEIQSCNFVWVEMVSLKA